MLHAVLFLAIGLLIGSLIGVLAVALLLEQNHAQKVIWFNARQHMPVDYEESDNRIHLLVADAYDYIYEDTWNTNTLSYEGSDDPSQILYFAYIEDLRDTLPTTLKRKKK